MPVERMSIGEKSASKKCIALLLGGNNDYLEETFTSACFTIAVLQV
jgi:hypothetical protein